VEAWLSGVRRASVRVPARPAVTRVEVDAAGDLPYLRRDELVWRAGNSR
jgi:hypothetical protein